MKEHILCAAIWYKETTTAKFLPVNIDHGTVICGHRHPHCIHTLVALTGKRSVTFGDQAIGEHEQGFLTNTNRFVDREVAAEIAFSSGQIKVKLKTLYSEDIY